MPRPSPFADGIGDWSDDARLRFEDGRYDGVFYRFRSPTKHSDLAFLNDLSGLKYVEIDGPVRDDTSVFGLPLLEEAVLLTRCRRPIPAIKTYNLRVVGFDDRPGKENLAASPMLEDVGIAGWKGPDLSFVSGMRSLRSLKLEGEGQVASLSGIENCAELENLEIVNARVDNLAPLGGLLQLKLLHLIGSPNIDIDPVLDLADLEQLASLQELVVSYAGAVKSFEPLVRHRQLREVRLRGTFVIDGDHLPLGRLPADVTLVGPED
jgi:hypothetical protein